MKRAPPSLQTRALGWLAQREHSRSELRRKLLRHALSDADDGAAEQVEQLLDLLHAKGLLSEQRFIESRLRLRSAGMGAKRIQAELAQHGLKLPAPALEQLRASELQRAAELCRRRFSGPADDARERARRARFLAGRGFSGDVIRRVLSGHIEARDGDPFDE